LTRPRGMTIRDVIMLPTNVDLGYSHSKGVRRSSWPGNAQKSSLPDLTRMADKLQLTPAKSRNPRSRCLTQTLKPASPGLVPLRLTGDQGACWTSRCYVADPKRRSNYDSTAAG
jgi:hypothetical protein